MYNVSEKFKSAIKASNRKSAVYGTLTTVNGVEYPLNDSNIIKDSLYITNQIVNNNKLTFGAVYAGECGLVISSTIDRYSLFGATIVLNFLLNLEDGTEEILPLGVFYVDTPERIGSKIKLTAVDCMSRFDVPVDEDVNGTWYELISYMADKCGVELAQTQTELEALHVNVTSQIYTIRQDRIGTYRDALSFLAMIICANATIDNAGKLKFVQYATSACDSNNGSTRLNNCKFSDYTTRYAGVKARFIADENYAPYSAVNEDIDGLILDLGDIPIVGGTADTKNATVEAIMQTITQISYVPATLYISSNPAYELGDMITCENVNNTTDDVNVYVMAYKYNYRKKETINCYGDNPLLQNIKDKNNNFNTSDLEAQISAKQMVIVNATNIKDITITQEFKEIVTLNFSVNSDCRPICIFTVPFSIDIDGYVEFGLYDGLVALDNATYKGYYEKGEHFATFMYLDDMKKYARRSLRVLAKCYADVTSATRVQDAKLKAIENGWGLIVAGTPAELEDIVVDATEPTAIVKALAVKAIAYTQGINSKAVWDGIITISDEIPKEFIVSINEIKTTSVIDSLYSYRPVHIAESEQSQIVPKEFIVTVPTVSVSGIDYVLGIGEMVVKHTIKVDVDNDISIPYPKSIESEKIDLTHHSIVGIESVTVNGEGNPLFAVSFDDKTTWYAWNGTSWEFTLDEFSGMTKDLLEAVTSDNWNLLSTGTDSFYIRTILLDNTSSVNEIIVKFVNQ